VLKKEKVYILKNVELKTEIIWLHHDVLVVGYEGRWKTTVLITRNYWWPRVIKDVGRYVDSCDICQRMKNRMKTLAGKLKLSKILEKL